MSDYTCKRCSHTGPWGDGDEFVYVSDPLDGNRGIYFCAKCAVSEWPCPIRFVFHVGTPEWVRERMATPKMLSRLRAWFGEHSPQGVEDFAVHYFHRREAETLSWLAKWDTHRTGKPVEPYSYRGWCNAGDRIVILVDETEIADVRPRICASLVEAARAGLRRWRDIAAGSARGGAADRNGRRDCRVSVSGKSRHGPIPTFERTKAVDEWAWLVEAGRTRDSGPSLSTPGRLCRTPYCLEFVAGPKSRACPNCGAIA